MKGSLINQLFERQRALLEETLQKLLAMQEEFMLQYMRDVFTDSVVVPVECSSSSPLPSAPPPDVRGFKHFIRDFSRGTVDYALRNAWYLETWGHQLDNGSTVHEIIVRTLSDAPPAIMLCGHDGIDICTLCGEMTRCTHQVNGRLLGTCCIPLAKALIAFFGYIWECRRGDVDWDQRFITASDKFEDLIRTK